MQFMEMLRQLDGLDSPRATHVLRRTVHPCESKPINHAARLELDTVM